MKQSVSDALGKAFQWTGVICIILITIGFFNTPHHNGKAIMLTEELLFEKKYVESISTAINEFTELTLEIDKINEDSRKGKVVPMKVAQVYSTVFDEMQKDYNALSFEEVPERFKTFHTAFLKTMELKGATLTEYSSYLNNKEESHLLTVEKYNEAFARQYTETINLFNRLLEEQKLN